MLRRAASSGSNLPSCGAVLLVVFVVLVETGVHKARVGRILRLIEAAVHMQTRTHREGQRAELLRANLDLKVDHKPSDQTKEDLRDRKPQPVDPLIQDRADDPQRSVQ